MTEDADKAYAYRPYCPDDIPFIHSSWGSSYYKGAGYKDLLSPKEFHEHHRPIRERFFQFNGSAIIVCIAKSDPTHILGWCAIEKPPMSGGMILHYIYTKQAFKGEKIATGLLAHLDESMPIMYTHITDRAAKIMDKKHELFKDWHFCPHLT